jgi:hypothetical protein
METRLLGRTQLRVGEIGLGLEHLNVSRDNMDAVFDLSVASGLNYVDVLYNDPDAESAEHWKAIGPALRRYRDSLVLALHWGLIYHEEIELCQSRFDACLEQVGGHAEIGMMTMVDTKRLWNGWAQESLKRLEKYRAEGCIDYIGMSNHNPTVARTAVESGLIDVLMFPVNLYQHEGNEECTALLKRCAELNVGVVAMKPYYGGKLIQSQGRPTKITPIQCLHYVLCQQVAIALPGPKTAQELRAALNYESATPEQKQYEMLSDDLQEELRGQCVQCRHCLPCPVDIQILSVILNVDYVDYYSGTRMSEDLNRRRYAKLPVGASACTECGVCEERCPFDVAIIEKMHRAVDLFETVR